MESRFSNMAKTVIGRGLMRTLAQVFFPQYCVVCKKEGSVLCEECYEKSAARMTRGVLFERGMATSYYHDVTHRTLLQMYKYDGIADAGNILEKLFRAFLIRHEAQLRKEFFYGHHVTVIPVPLHWFRERLRGFNQIARCAQVTAQIFGAAYCDDVLVRRLQWRAQATITDNAARAQNASRSVRSRSGARIAGDVVLVDDVYTTGATVAVCADELIRIGAKNVYVLAILKGK